MSHHILLATTGESPQVVTETLYAIAKEGLRWPDEIRLITTSVGQARAQKGLIDEGHLARLCAELALPVPAFDVQHIEVVPDASGQPVDDARSLEDHEALADFIMSRVRDLTALDEQTLHASLAGGRKTMTFYLGYAMSLFGRREDRLSHVLVSQGFESNPGFWFPTEHPEHRYLQNRQGERLDAAQASVTLAPIPFIRHRQELPTYLRTTAKLHDHVNFKRLVELINLGEQPEKLDLTVDLPNQTLVVKGSDQVILAEVKPSKLDLAFFMMVLNSTLRNESDLTRPSKGKPSVSLAFLYLEEFMPLFGLQLVEGKTAAETVSLSADLLSEEVDGVRDDTFSSLKTGMKVHWFDQRRNALRTSLEEYLPRSVCKHLLPEILWSADGTLLSSKPTEEEEKAQKALEKEAKKQAKANQGRRRQSAMPKPTKANYSSKNGGYGIPLALQYEINIIEMPSS